MTYTAEDFKNARFAQHRHGAKAVRWEMNYRVPWHTVIGDRFSDEQMAESGWRPIHEHNPHATDALEEMVDDLREGNAKFRVELRMLRDEVRDLREAPLTLDTLRAAWENAEQADECRTGDVLIWADGLGGYHVRPSEADRPLSVSRILSRAPQREPWQDLADDLEAIPSCIANAALARNLYEAGWRKTGGDEK